MERSEIRLSSEIKAPAPPQFRFDGLVRLLVVSGIAASSLLGADYFVSNNIDSVDKLRDEVRETIITLPRAVNG